MHYQVTHKTAYEYDQPVAVSHHLLRLKPRARAGQIPLRHEFRIEPRPALLRPQEDYFGNHATFLTIEGSHHELSVVSESVIDLLPEPTPEPGATIAWEIIRDLCAAVVPNMAQAACEFAFPSPMVPTRPAFLAYASPSFPPHRPVLAAAADLMSRIHAEFTFDTRATNIATPVEHVLRERRGVCQDFAHFQIACLRSLGLPARYVSGYLETQPPPGKPRLVGADASHAWLQIWCGETGWVDLDPTNNVLPRERHLTVAWGRDFGDVSPLRGVLVGSGRHRLRVAVDVRGLEGANGDSVISDERAPK